MSAADRFKEYDVEIYCQGCEEPVSEHGPLGGTRCSNKCTRLPYHVNQRCPYNGWTYRMQIRKKFHMRFN